MREQKKSFIWFCLTVHVYDKKILTTTYLLLRIVVLPWIICEIYIRSKIDLEESLDWTKIKND